MTSLYDDVMGRLVPVAAAVTTNTPTPTVVAVTIQSDSYMDVNGSIRYKGVDARGRPVPDDNESLKLGASMAGMLNFPWPMNLQKYVVCIDPAWWAHLAEVVVVLQNSLETPAEAFAASVRLALDLHGPRTLRGVIGRKADRKG